MTIVLRVSILSNFLYRNGLKQHDVDGSIVLCRHLTRIKCQDPSQEEFGSSSLYDTYNPKNWSGTCTNSDMDQNDFLPLESNSSDPMMGIFDTDILVLEKPLELTSADCLLPFDISLEMPEFFDLDLEEEFQIIGDISGFEVSSDPHCELDEDLINLITNNEFLNEIYPSDSEDERRFGPESMRIVNPSDVTNYFPESLKNNLVTLDWREVLKDHDYCLDENCCTIIEPQSNEPIPMEIVKNVELEANVDVWGSSSNDSSSMGRCSKFVQQPNLATSFKEDTNNTGLHCEVAGVNKLPRTKCFSNPTRSIMENVCVALKRSGSRRSARNSRPKGSVETTPSGSDFEDGYHMYTKPQKRVRGSRCSVNRTSNKSLSEYNFEDRSRWYPKKRQTKQKRSACRSTNFLPPFQLYSEDESRWFSKERPSKRTRTTSQSVGRTSNQANRRTVGRNVPKSTKKKTLKEKQGHKDNEKLRRDKLRDAFINLREEIPLHCLIRDTDKPSVMISKQKILNGAVMRIKGISKYKQKMAKKFASCVKKIQIYRKILAKNRLQIIINSYK